MPAVCCLTNKATGKSTPEGITFQEIDAELCKHFNQPCDEVEWFNGWYDHHCFRIALGHSLHRIKDDDLKVIEEYQAKERTEYNINVIKHYLRHVDISNYLIQHYTTDSWHERRST